MLERKAHKYLTSRTVHLGTDVVNLSVLLVDLIAHVHGHSFQVANDAAHRVQILLHLILACIVGNSAPKM